jgi:hypothetical protein
LYAFEFEDQAIKWQQQPELPYPEYTDLYEDGKYLFVGYENERIAALSEITGSAKINTKTLVDSVPEKIGVSGNYFIGDFKKRSGQGRAWISFYKETGAVYGKFQSDIMVVEFYSSREEGLIDFTGNKESKGIFGQYDIENNDVKNQKVVNEGEITYCCKLNETNYLIAVGSNVYSITIDGNDQSLFTSGNFEIVGLDYDSVGSRVFVITRNTVQIYNHPNAQLLKTITSSEEIKAVRLRFGY